MRTPINDHCFQEPHWRLKARGLDPDSWFEQGVGKGTGGILNPQRKALPTGEYYYRFASTTAPRFAQFGGPWWLNFENFRTVRAFAQDNGYSLRDAARLTLALPYDWTRVDLLIRALLVQPLDAYAGHGNQAQGPQAGPDRGTVWIPTQHIKIEQLYIPGLYIKSERIKVQLYETAFEVRDQPTRLWQTLAA